MLFAQAGGGVVGPAGGPGGPPPGMPGAVVTILILYGVIFGGIFIVAFTLQVLYCMAASKCLKQIAPRNRQAEPGSVWLALIPCIGFIFHFMTSFKMVGSVKSEFQDRGWKPDGDHGQLWVILELVGAFTFLPLWLVAAIMSWIKVLGYARQFEEDRPTLGYDTRRRYDDDDEDEDDEDDRPRRNRDGYRRRYD